MNSAIAGQLIYMFKGDASNLEKTTKSVNGGFKGMTKSMLVANLATKAISAGFNLIAQNSDRAIQRIDTFNAFPKVMKNFGVSTQEADASIKRMDKAMRGLPTSLDQAVSGVQNLFMVTKDLPEAERMFKAINDSAMVFANGSTEAVDRFSYAFKQAMSSGKVSAQDFNQMNEAIPGLMDKVAESMGLTYAELKQGLSDGSISMDQFNTALKKLDTEGGAGMESLEKSAKTSTGGIATSIQNAKTAVVRGVSELFKAVDTGLKNAGLGGISEVVSNMGSVLEKALKKLAPYIVKFIKLLSNIFNWIKKNQTLVLAIVVPIVAVITTVKTLITIINTFKMAMMLLNAVLAINPFILIVGAIVGLIALFVVLWNKCEWFRNFWIGLWEGIKSVVITVWEFLKGVFDTVINFFKSNWKQLLLFIVNPFAGAFALLYNNCEGFRNFVNGFVEKIKSFFVGLAKKIASVVTTIVSAIKSIATKVSSIPGKIISFFSSLPNKMKNIGINVAKGIGNGITSGVTWIKNKVKQMVGNVTDFIKKVFKIGSPSKLMAQEVGQWIPKGIAVGITANTDSVYDSMKNMNKDLVGISPQLTGSMNNHYSPNINVTNNVDVSTDPLGQTVKKIKTFSGGAKNDYNYGMGV